MLDLVCEVFPADRVGVRLSPLGQANDMRDSDPEATFGAAYRMLSARQLAYLHVIEAFGAEEPSAEQRAMLQRLRVLYAGTCIGNGSYRRESAAAAINDGRADAVSFGRAFLANPDLPERLRVGAALNTPDQDTFYGGDAHGYTDYPSLAPDH